MRQRSQYEDFEASELFCQTCGRSRPVQKKLLLVLPEGNKYDYLCTGCGSSVGSKMDGDKGSFEILRP